jgi:hypothetical protein
MRSEVVTLVPRAGTILELPRSHHLNRYQSTLARSSRAARYWIFRTSSHKAGRLRCGIAFTSRGVPRVRGAREFPPVQGRTKVPRDLQDASLSSSEYRGLAEGRAKLGW